MRWLVGWSSAAPHGAPAAGGTLHPVGAQQLWGDPDPLWAVGDWRPDEVRVIRADSTNRLAVLGSCGASDDELRNGLFTARGGAFRHLTAWPGSYTAIACTGRRITIAADLAGVRPVFHTPWAGGTAYATAALPLADLIEAQLDIGHLGALLACPDAPEALGEGTPYAGVRRVPPGHALIMREGGTREITGYEPTASLVVSPPSVDADSAVAGVRDALVEAVRARLSAPRHASESTPHASHAPPHPGADHNGRYSGSRYSTDARDPGPVPGMGPAERRAARGAPAPGVGADLSGGPASGTLALLAAGLPGMPGTVLGAEDGTEAGERLLAVTFNDLATGGPAAADTTRELEQARSMAANPRLHHLVVTGGEDALPYAELTGPLTDEPGPSLILADRHRQRLAAGSADHLVGHGARQALDAHPARLADLLLDRRRRHLLRPVAALARAERAPAARTLRVPIAVYRAARRLARTPYRDGVMEAAQRLRDVGARTYGQRRRRAGPGSSSGAASGGNGGNAAGGTPVGDTQQARTQGEFGDSGTPTGTGRTGTDPTGTDPTGAGTPRSTGDSRSTRGARRSADPSATTDPTASASAGSHHHAGGNDNGGHDGRSTYGSRTAHNGRTPNNSRTANSVYGAQSAARASIAALTWCRPGPAARWLTGEALAEVALRLEAAATLRPTIERPGERRASAALARQAADYRVLEQAAEIRNQRLHAPFYDNQVIRACRTLPEPLRVRPGARASVLRAVLTGAGVRELPTGWGSPAPSPHTAPLRAGLRAAADDLLDLFDAPLLADAGLIEAHVVRKAIRAAARGNPLPLDGLADLVSTELWLRRLLARRGTCWTGSAAPRRRAASAGVIPRGQHRPAL